MHRLYLVPPPAQRVAESVWAIAGPLSILAMSFSLPAVSFLRRMPLAKPRSGRPVSADNTCRWHRSGRRRTRRRPIAVGVGLVVVRDRDGQLSHGSATKSPSVSKFIATASMLSAGVSPSAPDGTATTQPGNQKPSKMSDGVAHMLPTTAIPAPAKTAAVPAARTPAHRSRRRLAHPEPAGQGKAVNAAPGRKMAGGRKPGGGAIRMSVAPDASATRSASRAQG